MVPFAMHIPNIMNISSLEIASKYVDPRIL